MKEKIGKLIIKTKSFCSKKDLLKEGKDKTTRQGENICNYISDKGLVEYVNTV